ncbi:hypothetical protein HDV05_005184 [Chytridiales sp. JEL 0842]|nr:hypothetical protein HDV05_005184 [Chytridiales sp. JEL 0842]
MVMEEHLRPRNDCTNASPASVELLDSSSPVMDEAQDQQQCFDDPPKFADMDHVPGCNNSMALSDQDSGFDEPEVYSGQSNQSARLNGLRTSHSPQPGMSRTAPASSGVSRDRWTNQQAEVYEFCEPEHQGNDDMVYEQGLSNNYEEQVVHDVEVDRGYQDYYQGKRRPHTTAGKRQNVFNGEHPSMSSYMPPPPPRQPQQQQPQQQHHHQQQHIYVNPGPDTRKNKQQHQQRGQFSTTPEFSVDSHADPGYQMNPEEQYSPYNHSQPDVETSEYWSQAQPHWAQQSADANVMKGNHQHEHYAGAPPRSSSGRQSSSEPYRKPQNPMPRPRQGVNPPVRPSKRANNHPVPPQHHSGPQHLISQDKLQGQHQDQQQVQQHVQQQQQHQPQQPPPPPPQQQQQQQQQQHQQQQQQQSRLRNVKPQPPRNRFTPPTTAPITSISSRVPVPPPLPIPPPEDGLVTKMARHIEHLERVVANYTKENESLRMHLDELQIERDSFAAQLYLPASASGNTPGTNPRLKHFVEQSAEMTTQIAQSIEVIRAGFQKGFEGFVEGMEKLKEVESKARMLGKTVTMMAETPDLNETGRDSPTVLDIQVSTLLRELERGAGTLSSSSRFSNQPQQPPSLRKPTPSRPPSSSRTTDIDIPPLQPRTPAPKPSPSSTKPWLDSITQLRTQPSFSASMSTTPTLPNPAVIEIAAPITVSSCSASSTGGFVDEYDDFEVLIPRYEEEMVTQEVENLGDSGCRGSLNRLSSSTFESRSGIQSAEGNYGDKYKMGMSDISDGEDEEEEEEEEEECLVSKRDVKGKQRQDVSTKPFSASSTLSHIEPENLSTDVPSADNTEWDDILPLNLSPTSANKIARACANLQPDWCFLTPQRNLNPSFDEGMGFDFHSSTSASVFDSSSQKDDDEEKRSGPLGGIFKTIHAWISGDTELKKRKRREEDIGVRGMEDGEEEDVGRAPVVAVNLVDLQPLVQLYFKKAVEESEIISSCQKAVDEVVSDTEDDFFQPYVEKNVSPADGNPTASLDGDDDSGDEEFLKSRDFLRQHGWDIKSGSKRSSPTELDKNTMVNSVDTEPLSVSEDEGENGFEVFEKHKEECELILQGTTDDGDRDGSTSSEQSESDETSSELAAEVVAMRPRKVLFNDSDDVIDMSSSYGDLEDDENKIEDDDEDEAMEFHVKRQWLRRNPIICEAASDSEDVASPFPVASSRPIAAPNLRLSPLKTPKPFRVDLSSVDNTSTPHPKVQQTATDVHLPTPMTPRVAELAAFTESVAKQSTPNDKDLQNSILELKTAVSTLRKDYEKMSADMKATVDLIESQRETDLSLSQRVQEMKEDFNHVTDELYGLMESADVELGELKEDFNHATDELYGLMESVDEELGELNKSTKRKLQEMEEACETKVVESEKRLKIEVKKNRRPLLWIAVTAITGALVGFGTFAALL